MSTYERVHPPEDSGIVTLFPEDDVMALYGPGESEPFISGNYYDLDRVR